MLTADILTLSWQMLGLKSLWDNKNNNNNNNLFEKQTKLKLPTFVQNHKGCKKKCKKTNPKIVFGDT
jgi:hypothetical protein